MQPQYYMALVLANKLDELYVVFGLQAWWIMGFCLEVRVKEAVSSKGLQITGTNTYI